MSTLLEMGVRWGRLVLSGRGRFHRLLAGGCLALAGGRDARVAGKLAKTGIRERGKLRYPHRRPARAERGEYGCDVLFLRRVKSGLGAAQSPGCRCDGFIVLIHSADLTVNGLRCHGI